jgi:RNA polymerase sigma-70 factor (ECF subfamily)
VEWVVRLVDRDEADKLRSAERALIRSAQGGDRRAFAALVERYWDRLYRWLYHLTHDPHLAEDLAQETFLKAFAGLGKFRADSNFQAWLFRIGHNNFINQRRAARARQPFPEHLPAPDEGPLEQALNRESLQLLARAVGRLPAEFRAAFLLRAEEDLSFREIADVLDITEETARWRVFKARQKLLGALAPQLDREKP